MILKWTRGGWKYRPWEGEPTPPKPDEKKTFTQEEVNEMLAGEKRGWQKKLQGSVDELEALRTTAKLTQEERDELDKKIEGMKKEYLTKEELAKRDRDKLANELKEKEATLSKDRDSWRDRFTESTISRSITDTAVKHDAYSPKQLVSILRPTARLIERMGEDDKPTGEYDVKVDFREEDGKVLELGVNDAVKRMLEMDEYANLFKAKGTGGTGQRPTNGKAGALDPVRLATENPEKYREMRRKGEIKLENIQA